MKRFWKYFLILILLLLGLGCIGILYLFFVPNSNLFGIQYIAYNKAFHSTVYDSQDVNKISLTSLNYDVRIVPSVDNSIRASVHCYAFGFVKVTNSELHITSSLNNGELLFNIQEPNGALVPNNSYIQLSIPSKQFDLSLKNNQATTKINSSDIKIGSLNYTTNNGTFELTLGTINGNLNLDIGNSIFKLASGAVIGGNDVNLKLTTGKFDSSTCSLGDIKILANKRGVINVGTCNTLTQDVETAGGKITAKKANHLTINTSDTNVEINEITLGAVINLTSLGKINIQTLSGSSVLKTKDGNISVGTNNSSLTAETTNGDIAISSANAAVYTKSERGAIKVHFADDAPAYSISSNTRYLSAEINKGSLTATGVDKIEATSKGAGSINVTMNNILSDNLISSKDGNIRVVINADAVCKLVTKSDNGSVRVNLSQLSEYGGYTTKTETTTYVNSTEADYNDNVFLIESSFGAVTVLDTNLI